MPPDSYNLVQLRNGEWAVHSGLDAETMHPGHGPEAEAKALYVEQLGIAGRVGRCVGDFVIWDVGLGAAANALAAVRACAHLPASLHIVSFDSTAEPLLFALQNSAQLHYLRDYHDATAALASHRTTEFSTGKLHVRWDFEIGDFPTSLPHLQSHAKPHAIFFDPFSPARNPSMWTQMLFADLFQMLDTTRPCSLATYSRSTMVRVALLLAGFYVGRGHATGLKEETTIAATVRGLVADPLNEGWLKTAQRSRSAEPLRIATYSQAPLAEETFQRLRAHPQFQPAQP